MSLEDGPRIYTCTGGLEPVQHHHEADIDPPLDVAIDIFESGEDGESLGSAGLPEDHEWRRVYSPADGEFVVAPVPKQKPVTTTFERDGSEIVIYDDASQN